MSVIIHRQYLDIRTLEATAVKEQLRPCPPWLGNFHFKIYGEAYGRYYGKLPLNLRHAAEHMEKLTPDEFFNAAFLQRYQQGESVYPHRDPANNLNCTLIGLFGSWEGATLTVDGKDYHPVAGDVVQLRCTINGVRGPVHQVSPVTKGTRWALILNTIMD